MFHSDQQFSSSYFFLHSIRLLLIIRQRSRFHCWNLHKWKTHFFECIRCLTITKIRSRRLLKTKRKLRFERTLFFFDLLMKFVVVDLLKKTTIWTWRNKIVVFFVHLCFEDVVKRRQLKVIEQINYLVKHFVHRPNCRWLEAVAECSFDESSVEHWKTKKNKKNRIFLFSTKLTSPFSRKFYS